ncbi:MAG: hypothetical protein LBH58_05400 [Tannerellaceae bacterium]|jgi:proteasome lid subunit RPN8/RPN11|nr:hypothetical protein [Tannerellaceae bacterium]
MDYQKNPFVSQGEPVVCSSFSSSWRSVWEPKPYHKLYYLPKASQKLLEAIAWERKTPNNPVEQIGLLMGLVCQNGELETIFGEVYDIIPLNISDENLREKRFIQDLNPLINEITARQGNKKIRVIGFYHTHPKELKVKPSKFDMEVAKHLALQEEKCFISILSPQQTQWKAYWGSRLKECLGIIMDTSAELDDIVDNRPALKRQDSLKSQSDVSVVSESCENSTEFPNQKEPVFKIIKKEELILDKVTAVFLIEKYFIKPELRNCIGSENIILLTDNAKFLLFDHIGWGKKIENNIVEQGGLLIGKPYQVKDNVISIAESIIPAESTSSNAAYLNMGNDTWGKMLAEYDNRYAEKEYKIIGWYHTHPNSLSVFMSSTDMGTQKRFFNKKWHFALVLNPHKLKAKAFYSVSGAECRLGL